MFIKLSKFKGIRLTWNVYDLLVAEFEFESKHQSIKSSADLVHQSLAFVNQHLVNNLQQSTGFACLLSDPTFETLGESFEAQMTLKQHFSAQVLLKSVDSSDWESTSLELTSQVPPYQNTCSSRGTMRSSSRCSRGRRSCLHIQQPRWCISCI